MEKYLLEMREISKEFPGVKALSEVCLKVRKGEIHAVCGENGAGKSTLIKVLSGVYPHGSYRGEILLDGVEQKFSNIRDAERNGIVCIHQELALVNDMSIQENVFLGNEPAVAGVIRWDEMHFQTKRLLEKVDLKVSPEEKIRNLGIGQQQLVEIAKSLSKNAKILILDEPTSALTDHEVEVLKNILKVLRTEGVACIYISHKLEEVLELADTITVIRDGRSVASQANRNIAKEQLIYQMVGRELNQLFPREPHSRREVGFEIKDFSVYNPKIPGKKIVRDASFRAYKGEILGITGLMGAGRTELVEAVFGVYPGKSDGAVYVEGEKVKIGNSFDAIKGGIALVSEDRKKSGLVLNMNVKENTTIACLKWLTGMVLNESKEIYYTKENVSNLRIKTPSIETKVCNLSGGNQQKVVIGKWLLTEPKVLILDEPTRGIDVGAKSEIYKIMNQLVEKGVIIIMISSELEEVLGMSDRVLVMSEGRLVADLEIAEASQEKIMHYATGGH